MYLVTYFRLDLSVSSESSRHSRRCRPPSLVKKSGSSSQFLCTDFRVRGRSGPAHYFPKTTCEQPPVGFGPLSRHQHRGFIIAASFQGLALLPPSVFLTLSTVCSPRSLSGLFHPEATCGVHPSRAFPAAKPTYLVDSSCPHAVSDSRLSPTEANDTSS